ncbi:MAG: 16S rRNA (guanine(527)-N(7))-methyltransferase RsmG [Micromonosporaceae bacterium]|nr:16S rRNA (guanine(527)-N(7))-methyltransferase RsmG [Micromonosporaceae bacterium]
MTAGQDGGSAAAVFGARLPLAEEYARSLATDAVVRGLIGPREAPRVWERHLLNCAVVAELVPPDTPVTDVGSGAGLPGVALALARPDLAVTLVEAKERAAAYLSEVVTLLGLTGQVTVVRSRAEDCAGRIQPAAVVAARALAPLDRLAAWCLPLAAVGTGRVLALKGSSVEDEIATHAAAIHRLGGADPAVRSCGVGVLAEPTTVVEIRRERELELVRPRSRHRGPRRR